WLTIRIIMDEKTGPGTSTSGPVGGFILWGDQSGIEIHSQIRYVHEPFAAVWEIRLRHLFERLAGGQFADAQADAIAAHQTTDGDGETAALVASPGTQYRPVVGDIQNGDGCVGRSLAGDCGGAHADRLINAKTRLLKNLGRSHCRV